VAARRNADAYHAGPTFASTTPAPGGTRRTSDSFSSIDHPDASMPP
jgi:hypothetical protein